MSARTLRSEEASPTGGRARGVLERVDELLEVVYRQGDLGNVDDPLAEAVYIALSRQTQGSVYQATFAELRRSWPLWTDLLEAPQVEIEEVLRSSGLYRQRSGQLRELLAIVDEDNRKRGVGPYGSPAGDLTLAYLETMGEAEALAYLKRLPGIGEKSARCILSYTLGHETFAVDTHIARVLDRLALVERGGGKVKHENYDSVVPRGMRTRLHVNLIHHGREICRSEKPRCRSCVLVSFCEQGRKEVASRVQDERRVVDLFAGAGGLSAGYGAEGFTAAVAVELDRDSAQTYRANHPGTPVLEADITELTADELVSYAPAAAEPSAVIAGTPCQGYSAAGARDPEDPRNRYYKHVTRLARDLCAASITIENVPGLVRVNGTGFLDDILEELRTTMGWAARYELTASHFGVPQNRRRFMFLAAPREAVNLAVAECGPEPTHRPVDAEAGDGRFAGMPTTRTLRQAIESLPELGPGVEAEWVVEGGRVLLNASTMRHSQEVIDKISGIRQGEGPISYRRLTEDMARTLVAGHRALPVHPWLHRTISVREAARIQDFEDTWVLCGPRSKQPIQVANAVPPPLGGAIAHFHSKAVDLRLAHQLLTGDAAAGAEGSVR